MRHMTPICPVVSQKHMPHNELILHEASVRIHILLFVKSHDLGPWHCSFGSITEARFRFIFPLASTQVYISAQ